MQFANCTIRFRIINSSSLNITDSIYDGNGAGGSKGAYITGSSTNVTIKAYHCGNFDIAIDTASNLTVIHGCKFETGNIGVNVAAGIQHPKISQCAFSVTTPIVQGTNKPTIWYMGLINNDETQASATVPNTDTTLKTLTIDAIGGFATIIIEAEGYVQFTATSTLQDVNLKLKQGAGPTQVGNTLIARTPTAAAAKIPFKLTGVAPGLGGAVAFIMTIGAAAADANTTVFINNFRLFGVL